MTHETKEDGDRRDRAILNQLELAVAGLNEALRDCTDRAIRVEFGFVVRNGASRTAEDWRELWNRDGLAVRATKSFVIASPEPEPPVKDGWP